MLLLKVSTSFKDIDKTKKTKIHWLRHPEIEKGRYTLMHFLTPFLTLAYNDIFCMISDRVPQINKEVSAKFWT